MCQKASVICIYAELGQAWTKQANLQISPFHGDNTGSNPVGDAKIDCEPKNTSKQLKREELEGFKLSVFLAYVKPPENKKV
jgi:hypothetical protein